MGRRLSERMGTPPAAPGSCRLRIKGGFAVVDRQQRRLHHRAPTLGFADLDTYLAARCQDHASVAQLASELHTTIDVIRRLIDQAGMHRSPRTVLSACQRRLATDRHLTERAGQLGFADLEAYLADRAAQRAWPLPPGRRRAGCGPQHRQRRLNACGLRRTKPTVR
jgi:hypothetical protein